MKSYFRALIVNPEFLLVVYCLVAIVAAITQVLKDRPGDAYTHYNNYLIFKNAFIHLIHNADLYQLWPEDQWDYYKYSPSFALLMAPFSFLNNYIGLIIWDLLNALVLYFAVHNMPFFSEKARVMILWFILLELLTSMQNSQSNGLMAGLMIAGFNSMEKRRFFQAALLITLGVYIKIFALPVFALFMLYPGRIKSIFYAAVWMLVFALLPVIVVGWEQTIFLYKSWMHLLADDHSASTGLSVMGWFNTWFGFYPAKMLITVVGALLLILPFARWKLYNYPLFRLLLLASVLIWVIIFNHKAESPTFIVAMAGISLWYFSKPRKWYDSVLLFLALLLTSLSPTDMFPAWLRQHLVIPYVLKAVPCIIIWLRLETELMLEKQNAFAVYAWHIPRKHEL